MRGKILDIIETALSMCGLIFDILGVPGLVPVVIGIVGTVLNFYRLVCNFRNKK